MSERHTHVKLDPVEYAAHVLAPLERDPGDYIGRHRTDYYRPLFAERRCVICGFWRGQHIGLSVDDAEMKCPTTFKPGMQRGIDYNTHRYWSGRR